MDEVKHESKKLRSYGQYCGLARALDLVGDRWTLLVVRELLPVPMRYTELKASLAGIATNLLAERLRSLEANGIVERRLEETGVVYALTPWGAGLRAPIEAFLNWSVPLMAVGRNEDSFQPRWLAVALPGLLREVTSAPPVELGIQTDGLLVVLRIDEDGPHVNTRPDQQPDTVLTAAPEVVLGLAAGALTIDQALALGEIRGDKKILKKVFPPGRATAASRP